ncbi:hypothetical protein BC834DRAFT_543922 [Gloeopeniophorella convolvens]|nr:hypothetical protein BC834DRAFT_543922 [Gloeopeniophorella convolvens]
MVAADIRHHHHLICPARTSAEHRPDIGRPDLPGSLGAEHISPRDHTIQIPQRLGGAAHGSKPRNTVESRGVPFSGSLRGVGQRYEHHRRMFQLKSQHTQYTTRDSPELKGIVSLQQCVRSRVPRHTLAHRGHKGLVVRSIVRPRQAHVMVLVVCSRCLGGH